MADQNGSKTAPVEKVDVKTAESKTDEAFLKPAYDKLNLVLDSIPVTPTVRAAIKQLLKLQIVVKDDIPSFQFDEKTFSLVVKLLEDTGMDEALLGMFKKIIRMSVTYELTIDNKMEAGLIVENLRMKDIDSKIIEKCNNFLKLDLDAEGTEVPDIADPTIDLQMLALLLTDDVKKFDVVVYCLSLAEYISEYLE